MTVITGDHAGSIIAQRLLPTAILFPPTLCWLVLVGFRQDVYSPEMGISILGILNIIIFAVLIWWNSLTMSHIDLRRSQAEASLKQTLDELELKVQQQESLALQLQKTFTKITTSMNELAASSNSTAQQATAADQQAQKALNLCQKGTVTVAHSQQVMTQLEENVTAIGLEIVNTQQKASQIADISGLVKDLANQTNMLALNAAIEAVNAGEYGRGFGVVASEIRKLADQSKTYAETINLLVSQIQNAVQKTSTVTEQGIQTVTENVQVVEQTASAFTGVLNSIEKIVVNNEQISLTANQQAIAIQQVVNIVNEVHIDKT
ncbi:hypothetical protein K4A83_06175 [Spirulina subsalsa FACHB-351]|uniref:Methyl-accepting transducer domain-containing protein n=1 Tax=Spirulina subsalsa FACHB-351 TaxID=234711 RepID=A0ABT3L4F3_9CYAN|nr:methyl-accepting chemotaxis protein [Spirulina subsalsa]MCW6035860.1 hypothetical protein [Spirulina subsalsa FACHB-351]